MTPSSDAIRLARCAYIGNWKSYWSILEDYLSDQQYDDADTEPLPRLILALADEINSMLRVDELPDPQEWFDTRLRLAEDGRDDGLE